MKFDEQTFLELIQQAVDLLPDEFRDRMENVEIEVLPLADPDTCRKMGIGNPYNLLGLYHGVPLTERHVEGAYWPDHITIYQKSIEAASEDQPDAVERIRVTVLHEIGHFFGMTEDDLRRAGYD